MAIETLQDILTELGDKLGIYGAHGDENEEYPNDVRCSREVPCRMCFETDLRERILAAIEVERKLYPSELRARVPAGPEEGQ